MPSDPAESGRAIQQWTQDIHQGDAADTLAQMPENSVHMAMCSPPYYGLRDYDVDGQIGLEETLDEYIADLLDVASELHRVLRPDGSWWLNLGDTFASKPRGNKRPLESTGLNNNAESFDAQDSGRDTTGDLREKQKMLVPHRVAIALQDAGWYVRSDGVWAKPNPMPHPVKDRLHEHKEFVFHLTPAPDYWFDLDAIRQPHKASSLDRTDSSFDSAAKGSPHMPREDGRQSVIMDAEDALHPAGKNPGDIFEVAVKPFPDAHFAVYPPELVEKPVKATCPPKVCADCGTPYERKTAEGSVTANPSGREQKERALELADEHGLTADHLEACRAVGFSDAGAGAECQTGAGNNDDRVQRLAAEAKDVLGGYFREFCSPPTVTDGWTQACDCDTSATDPGIVLDPFAGAGTTCLVAKRLGRRFVGIDLSPDYVAMAQKRVGVTVDEPDRLLDDGETNLVAFADGGGPDA